MTLCQRAQSNGNNYKECRKFYNAIKKYGWNNFVPEIIEDNLSEKQAKEKERYYISLYNSTNDEYGYNISPGGDIITLSPESRSIISQKAKDRYSDGISNPMFGKKHSNESKQKMSEKKRGENNPMFGKKRTEKQKMLCTTKGKSLNLTDAHREILKERAFKMGKKRAKKILCIDDDLEFKSLTEAAAHYGVHIASVCDQLKGRSRTCAGKKFSYIVK